MQRWPGPCSGSSAVSGGSSPRNHRLLTRPVFLYCGNTAQVSLWPTGGNLLLIHPGVGGLRSKPGGGVVPQALGTYGSTKGRLQEPRELLADFNGYYWPDFPLRLDKIHSLGHPHRLPIHTQELRSLAFLSTTPPPHRPHR